MTRIEVWWQGLLARMQREPALVGGVVACLFELAALLRVDVPFTEAVAVNVVTIAVSALVRSRVTPTDRGVTPDGGMPLARLERKPSAPVRAAKQIGNKIRMSGWDD